MLDKLSYSDTSSVPNETDFRRRNLNGSEFSIGEPVAYVHAPGVLLSNRCNCNDQCLFSVSETRVNICGNVFLFHLVSLQVAEV